MDSSALSGLTLFVQSFQQIQTMPLTSTNRMFVTLMIAPEFLYAESWGKQTLLGWMPENPSLIINVGKILKNILQISTEIVENTS